MLITVNTDSAISRGSCSQAMQPQDGNSETRFQCMETQLLPPVSIPVSNIVCVYCMLNHFQLRRISHAFHVLA
jgi:hypothetical protein